MSVEWGVACDTEPGELHRGPMSEDEAREWVREWDVMAEKAQARKDISARARKGMFVVVRREVGPWRQERM
jgi:hypothetical protein